MTGGSSQKPSSRHCLPSPGRCDAVPSRASRTPSARRSLSSAAMRAERPPPAVATARRLPSSSAAWRIWPLPSR
ncbi:hypothetical protein G6F46_014910 [Rhizopus delemar]|nr:hypothetical protein G6F46_014910 [Rhizopus delemar]